MSLSLCRALLSVEFDPSHGQRIAEHHGSVTAVQLSEAQSLAMPENARFGTQKYCYRVGGEEELMWGYVLFSHEAVTSAGIEARGMKARSFVLLSQLDYFSLFFSLLDAIAESNVTLEVAYSQLSAAASPFSFGFCGRELKYIAPRGSVGLFHDVLLGGEEAILPHLWTLWGLGQQVCILCPTSAQRACAVVLELAGLFAPALPLLLPYSRVGGQGIVGSTSPFCLRGADSTKLKACLFLASHGGGAAKVKKSTNSPEAEFDKWLSSGSPASSLLVLFGADNHQREPDKDVWRRLGSFKSGLGEGAARDCTNMLLREHFRAKNIGAA
jgi:hypothetical protein